MHIRKQHLIMQIASTMVCLHMMHPTPASAASKSYIGNGYNAASKILFYDEDSSSGPGATGYFPFGYLLEPSGGNTGKLNCIRNLMGPAGMDVEFSPNGAVGEADKIPPMLVECVRYHISLLAGTYYITEQSDALNGTDPSRLMSLSGLLGWYHTDDADFGYPDFATADHGYPVATVVQRNAYAKSKDRGHITSMSLCGGASNEVKVLYAPTADFAGHQDYPNGYRTDNWDYWGTFGAESEMVAATSTAGTVPYSFTQSFLHGTTPRFPTAKDVDMQIYLCMIAGTKGIYFYAYRDSMEIKYEGFWNKTKQLCKEVKDGEFGRAILFGKRTAVNLAQNPTGTRYPKYYGIWEYNGTTYVVAINIDPLSSRAISIPLPAGTSGTMQSLFPYRSANLSYNADTKKLEGTLPTQTVEIYVIKPATGKRPGDLIQNPQGSSGTTPRLQHRFTIDGRRLTIPKPATAPHPAGTAHRTVLLRGGDK